jgi:hypothetical protein
LSQTPIVVLASTEDRLATRVARAVEDRGRTALYLDGPAAARLFTVKVDGAAGKVTPELPMFVRNSAWWRSKAPTSADERFIVGENYSMVWAVTALCPATVINRPSRNGWVDHFTPGTIAPLVDGEVPQGLTEVYASSPAVVGLGTKQAGDLASGGPATASLPWGKNVDQATGPVGDLAPGTPLRARLVDPDALYEVVTVVGERAFASTNDPRTKELRLVERSTSLAAKAGLHFATVTWAVHADQAEPVRLNSDVRESETRFAWPEVENALCEDLVA